MIKINLKIILSLTLGLGGFFLFMAAPAKAEDFFSLRTLEYPLTEDFTLVSPGGEVGLKIFAGSTDHQSNMTLMQIVERDSIGNFFTYDENLKPASDLYFLKFDKEEMQNFSVQPQMTISYNPDDQFKEAYYYNWENLKFEKLDSTRNTVNHTITFALPIKKSWLVALFDQNDLVGRASWYVHAKYAGQLIAASTDFAQNAKIRVINVDNNKEVTVVVKDYGPKKCENWTAEEQRKMGPCQERVVDLSKEAFRVLAPTSVGIINVKVIPAD